MDPEIRSFVQLWITGVVSLIFSHQVVRRVPSGGARILPLLPVVYLFSTLPFGINRYINIGGPAFFYFVWLGNFKLLLFAFDKGPLADQTLSLTQFVAVGLLPISLKSQTASESQTDCGSVKRKRFMVFLKLLLVAVTLSLFQYRGSINYYLICSLYCCHLYIALEVFLALTALPVRAFLGYKLDPQFDEPYLATSLQDFWGRRWNLVVTAILHAAVYSPVRRISTRLLGNTWARLSAIIATFSVSGLMHELIFYYMSRAPPTWEMTGFFVLHGVCVAVEIAVKKAVASRGGWSPPVAVSRLLTLGFMGITGAWLFFPHITRSGIDTRVINEYSMMATFLKSKLVKEPSS